MEQSWIAALVGGAIIGLSVSLMLLWNGRVTGISGIVGGSLKPTAGDLGWRLLFILGLLLGGVTLAILNPGVFSGSISHSWVQVVVAGLLVGFGTSLGSGCTSGHGVCGISRLSPRSLAATLSFILAGVAAVAIFRNMGVFG